MFLYSPTTASSVRCLDELVDIMDRFHKFDERKVLPVFLNVEPSHVRSQKGPFKKPFKAHETNVDSERVKKWKQTLKDTGQLCGLALQNGKYASDARCLDELVHIMDCRRKVDGRKVLPVFFNVEPSHVRSQKGLFTDAFQAHETNVDPERVQKWKQALKDAGQLSGLALQNGEEAEFVWEIVEELEKMRCPQELHVTDHPVGIGSRAEELISKLRLECEDDVFIVAVFGIGGIGKTAIVKETCNRIAAKFDVSCFLEDIRYLPQAWDWKVKLQKKLISYITQNDRQRIDGVTTIRKLIRGRKVLLVLDVVDDWNQLDALGINPQYFYNGSRIIVTTRDKESLGIILYESYHTKLLNRRESLNLFTRLMFARDDPVNTKFLEEVVSRAGGLPLVLKVWSCHFKHYEMEQWPSILETLKRIPHGDVQSQLKISYDSLRNRSKKLFLDIACFFDGTAVKFVKALQDEDSAFFPNLEIQYLVAKSLVEMRNSTLQIHHAIREMGEEIVRQENEDEPGQRTRLSDKRDVMRILTECSGTESVESIWLPFYFGEKQEKVTVQVEALRKMSNLRLIKLADDNLSWSNSSHDEMMTPLSFKKLRYMEWSSFPFKSINNIDMGNVVVVLLLNTKLEILWEGMKSLRKLRILDVGNSPSLTKTGDFYGVENLEKLYLRWCENLEELDRSIVCLHKLAILDLTHSVRLERLPWELIGNLPSLQKLKVCEGSGYKEVIDRFLVALKVPPSLLQLHKLNKIKLTFCKSIRSIPNLPQNITSIIISWCTNLVNLPSNMSELKSLIELDISDSPKLGTEDPQFLMKVTGLTNLRYLRVNGCSVSQVPSEIGNLVSLKILVLQFNTFSSLPDSFSNLSQLVHLGITWCDQLRLLPLLPSNLTHIGAWECRSLDVKSSGSVRTKVGKESPFTNSLLIELSKEEVPDWCSYRNRGHVLSFVAPMHSDKKICGIILCATISLPGTLTPIMLNKTKNTSHRMGKTMWLDELSMVVMFYPLDDTTLSVEPGDTVVLKFEKKMVSSCGLRLIYDSDVVDSKFVIRNVTFPSEMPTGITQLNGISDDSDDNDDSDSYSDDEDEFW